MWDSMSHGQVFLAQSGWNDTDELFFAGTEEDDGHTFVRCQLFSGRDISQEHTPDRAQGTKLLCNVADGVFKVPVKGARVYVLIPHGMEGVPGAGVIIASVTPGVERSSNIVAGEATLSAQNGHGRIRVKADGSVTMYTSDSNAKDGSAIFLRVSPTGLEFCSPFGRFRFDRSGFHVATAGGGSLDMGGIDLSAVPGIGALPSNVTDALTGYCTITSPQFHVESSMITFGPGAVHHPATFAPLNPGIGATPPSPLPPSSVYQSQSIYFAP